jgi:hypothetical protein
MRHSLLALLALAACSGPKPPPPMVTAAATADTVIVPVTEITAATPRGDGNWTVEAPIEGQVFVADFGTHQATPFPGITKATVPHPTTLIGAGDTIIVGDWGLRRFTAWTPTGTQVEAWPAPDALADALPRARDAAGQWYFQVSPNAGIDGSGLLDSAAIVRSDPQLSHFDTVARLAPPDLIKMEGASGEHYQRRILSGDDAWGVQPDGTLWIVRVFQNQVEWHRPGSGKVLRSPQLPDLVLPITDMDREIYVRRFPEAERETARSLPNSPVKPPFEHAFAVPGGRIWLAKSDTALARLRHFQAVDSTGVVRNIALPTYGSALGVTVHWILVGEEFPGGIRLLRFAVPPVPTDSLTTSTRR